MGWPFATPTFFDRISLHGKRVKTVRIFGGGLLRDRVLRVALASIDKTEKMWKSWWWNSWAMPVLSALPSERCWPKALHDGGGSVRPANSRPSSKFPSVPQIPVLQIPQIDGESGAAEGYAACRDR